jgi:radical SAM superfamily enzyme YgiQ (UPF0313 family)
MRQNGYTCQVIDFIDYMSESELMMYLDKFINKDTICIGVSSTFWNNMGKKPTEKASLPDIVGRVLKEIRARHPNIKLVLGGHTADFVSNETYELFDASIIGDAEDSFLELINSYKNEKKLFHAVTRGGKPFITAVPNKLFNIQHLAHRFSDNDCIVPGEALPIEISRGCIFKCAFCQYPHLGKTKFDYLREFELIGEEIEYNKNKFNTTNYYILDDTFNDSDYKIRAWHKLTSQLSHKINYVGYLRADLLSRNRDHIDLFRESGLMSCHFGIESFHPTASLAVGKGWSGKEAKIFLPELKTNWRNDVTIHTSLIVGLPSESWSDLEQTQDWFMNNDIDSWNFKPLLISAGNRYMSSDFDRNYEKYGFKLNNRGDWLNNSYMTSKQSVTYSKDLNSRGSLKQKITVWNAMSLLSKNISKNLVNSSYHHQIPWDSVTNDRRNFIKKYKLQLLSQ